MNKLLRYICIAIVFSSCASNPADYQFSLPAPVPPQTLVNAEAEESEPEVVETEIEEEIWTVFEDPNRPEEIPEALPALEKPPEIELAWKADEPIFIVEEPEAKEPETKAEPEIAAKPEEIPAAPPPPAPVQAAVQPPPPPPAPPPALPKTVRPAEPVITAPSEPPAIVAVSGPARAHPTETEAKEKNHSSRSVRAFTGQIVEVPFRGTGWVFLGEENSKRGMAYDSRRLDDEGQTFVFRAVSTGVYQLKFSKQDFLNNYYLNDTVEVIVGEPGGSERETRSPGTRPRVAAEPRWPAVGGAADTARSAVSVSAPEGAETSAQSAEAAPNSIVAAKTAPDAAVQPLDYLNQARADFSEGKFAETIQLLDLFKEGSPMLNDEAWWLYGQSFESNSAIRDVKSAADAYQHILRDYPQSKYYENARSRLAYLNRFYFNIR